MAKSVRVIIISVLLTVFIIIQSVPVFAVTIIKSNRTSCSEIEKLENPDGTLRSIKYVTSATGATSGIRYKFTAITIEIDGLNVVIPTKNLTSGAKPPPGVQEFYEITISDDDIKEQYQQQVGRELTGDENQKFKNAFADPGSIALGAHIEIYNANTGKVLETIRSFDEIRSKASKYGFPERNLEDMESRFKGQHEQDMIFGDPLTDETDPPKTGLRPSVIVD